MSAPRAVPDRLEILPLQTPPDATIVIPGSKSLTNRALVCAALAGGRSTLSGALIADDTRAMAGAMHALGATVELAEDGRAVVSAPNALQGAPRRDEPARVDARLSGTTARFVLPLACLAEGWALLDGGAPLRRRPLAPLVSALRAMGAELHEVGEPGHLPLLTHGAGLHGGTVSVSGDLSSQFVSALLLVAPALRDGLTLEVTSELVARPFVDLTLDVMRAFGAEVEAVSEQRYVVAPVAYRACDYAVEPDATTASYFFAAAAMTGGRVRVEGIGTASGQGDVAFLDVLEAMGAVVRREPRAVEVQGTGQLSGVDVNLHRTPDVAQTFAVLAAVATGPSRVRGVEVIRGHETDRITAVVAELTRCGVTARELPDGFEIEPAPIQPADVQTYDDHRMAMSFALLGLVAPGIRILDPACVSKTFPRYFSVLEELRRGDPGPAVPTLGSRT